MDAYGRRKIAYWRAGGDLWIGGRNIQSPRLKILTRYGVGGVGIQCEDRVDGGTGGERI
jgi:hypothetical protein